MANVTLLTTALAAAALLAGCAGEPGKRPPTMVTLDCGLQPILIEAEGDDVVVHVGKERYAMSPTVSASGARYQVPGDDATWLWNKGDTATLAVNGQPWPQCLARGAVEQPFKAGGNEPFWTLTADNGQMQLNRLGITPAAPEVYRQTSHSSGAVVLESDNLSARVEPGICRDTMTGMPYPRQVTVRVDGQQLNGCGGSPERLLQGAQWQVTRLGDQSVDASDQLSLHFFTNGQVSGRAACNQYGGEYRLDGEGLGISRVITTKMACPAPIMDREQQFLGVLAQVRGFDIGDDGELHLLGSDGDLLRARLIAR